MAMAAETSPGTSQHLVFGIVNDAVVQFKINAHGVAAGAGHFAHQIGMGQDAHMGFCRIVKSGFFRITGVYQHLVHAVFIL